MKTLISTVSAVRLAFGAAEPVPPETIAVADIAAAESRYIRPVLGGALHDAMLDGSYPDFVEGFLADPVALFARLTAQPRLDIKTGAAGAVAPKSAYAQPADERARRARDKALLREARGLLRRAAEHLDRNAASFPEYDPVSNPLKRCTVHGDFIATR